MRSLLLFISHGCLTALAKALRNLRSDPGQFRQESQEQPQSTRRRRQVTLYSAKHPRRQSQGCGLLQGGSCTEAAMRKIGGTSNNSNRKPEGIPDLLPQAKTAKRAGSSSPNATVLLPVSHVTCLLETLPMPSYSPWGPGEKITRWYMHDMGRQRWEP